PGREERREAGQGELRGPESGAGLSVPTLRAPNARPGLPGVALGPRGGEPGPLQHERGTPVTGLPERGPAAALPGPPAGPPHEALIGPGLGGRHFAGVPPAAFRPGAPAWAAPHGVPRAHFAAPFAAPPRMQ